MSINNRNIKLVIQWNIFLLFYLMILQIEYDGQKWTLAFYIIYASIDSNEMLRRN